MAAFSLELPNEEEIKAEVKKAAEVSEPVKEQISDLVVKNSQALLSVNLDDENSRMDCIHTIENFGVETLQKSGAKNDILKKRMYSFSEAGGEAGEVSDGLAQLAIKMKELDPNNTDALTKGRFGKLFNPAKKYFEKFHTADAEISSIVSVLEKGKKTLSNDNVTLELEQGSMRDLTRQLNQNIEIGMQMDAYIENEIATMQFNGGSEDKIKFVQEEILFPLRQKIQDFQQLLVVNQQGIIAMEIIRRNNRELIRSVDRASFVTVAALRTAVTVAGALYDQRIVLEKINALNAETNRMIEATGRMLREQGTEIQRQAEESALSPDVLKAAFADAIQALDDISAYKQEALPRIKSSIEEFRALADEGEKRLLQLEAKY